MCRVQICGMVDGAIRLVLACQVQQQFDETIEPRPFHVKQA